jgi:DNA-binding transcriptional ArsR family regulator
MLKYSGELDLVFQALADPTRRVLVERLSERSATVSELAAGLPISLSAVHQHLGVLETSGLVRSQKVGRVRTCHLELTMLDSADTWIEARQAMWRRRLDRLDTYLSGLPAEEASTDPEVTEDPDQPVTKKGN